MSERARIFKNGGSQAVRLPRSCRFDNDQVEVIARREGRKVIIEPANGWSEEFLSCLGSLDEDIPRLLNQDISLHKLPFSDDE